MGWNFRATVVASPFATFWNLVNLGDWRNLSSRVLLRSFANIFRAAELLIGRDFRKVWGVEFVRARSIIDT